MRRRLIGAGVATLLSVAASAAPAPWYRWKSLVNDQVVCAQASPGIGWKLAGGPYRDLHCTRPLAQ